jgi:hypothetical protein
VGVQVPPRTQFVSYKCTNRGLKSIRAGSLNSLTSVGHRVDVLICRTTRTGEFPLRCCAAGCHRDARAERAKDDRRRTWRIQRARVSGSCAEAPPGTANTFRRNTFGCSLDGRRPATMTSTVSASPAPRTNRCFGLLPPRLRLRRIRKVSTRVADGQVPLGHTRRHDSDRPPP